MFGTCGHWWEGVKSSCVCHEWYHHRSPTGTGCFRITPVFIWCWKEDPYLLWEWDQSTASERWWRGNHQLRRYQPHTTPEEHSESPTPELARDPDCSWCKASQWYLAGGGTEQWSTSCDGGTRSSDSQWWSHSNLPSEREYRGSHAIWEELCPVCEGQIAESTHLSCSHQSERGDLWEAVTQSGDSLTDTQEELLFLLLSQYPDVFVSHEEDYGTGKMKHQIHTGDAVPIQPPFCRIPPGNKETQGTSFEI